MKVARFLWVLAVGVFAVAEADTPNDVWNVSVAMNVPGGSNPLQGVVFKTFGKAESAMRGAHSDTAFLVQKSQTTGYLGSPLLTKFWIPPGDVATGVLGATRATAKSSVGTAAVMV